MDEELIGDITVEDINYQVDWPFRLDVPGEREDFATVYRDGRQIGEVTPLAEIWETTEDVLNDVEEALLDGLIGDDEDEE